MQDRGIGDPVANHFVDGSAHGPWEAMVVEWGRVSVATNALIMHLAFTTCKQTGEELEVQPRAEAYSCYFSQ